MKRLLILVPAALLVCATLLPSRAPGVAVLVAQSLPATAHAQFTPSTSAGIQQYAVLMDGLQVATFAASSCSATLCSAPFPIVAFGAHSVTVVAQNFEISTDPTTVQNSPPSAAAVFVLNQAPANAPTGVGVKQ